MQQETKQPKYITTQEIPYIFISLGLWIIVELITVWNTPEQFG
jgi:hypothetical protein